MSAAEAITDQVTSRDGAILGIEQYGSEHRNAAAASVLFIPALGVPIGYYRGMLSDWAARGRHIVAVELRGMPQSPVTQIRKQRFGYATIIHDDLPAITASEAFQRSGRIAVVGHSLGGQLALLAAAIGTIDASAVVTIASGTSSPASQQTRIGRIKRRSQVQLIRAVSAILGYWPGDRLGFGGRQPRTLMRDWCYEGSHGAYRFTDTDTDTDYEAALAQLPIPALAISLDGDQTIPLPAAKYLLHRLPERTEHRHITSRDPAGFDHIRWARHEHQPIIDATERWITAQTSSPAA
jgi:predicted alpha/beta hydrolase